MTMKFQSILTACGLLVMLAFTCIAAPLPPFPPVDVTGKIAEIHWVAPQQLQGIAGMSGSAGHDRTIPAHFIIQLTDYEGVDAETARQMTGYIDYSALRDEPENSQPSFILLRINSEDQHFLQEGMSFKVYGYSVRGDEGGTWTSHERLQILK